jgi:hypothetical protein
VNQPGLLLERALDEREQDFLFLDARLVEKRGVALLGAVAEMDEHRRVAAVVEDHVRRAAVAPFEDLAGVFPVVLEALALDGEDRNAAGGNRCRGMVLGRIDVARSPADVRAKRGQRFDQNRRLDRHVQGAGDAGALEHLLGAVFLARGHQARHLGFGDGDFLAAEFGEADVGDDIIGCGVLRFCCCGHDLLIFNRLNRRRETEFLRSRYEHGCSPDHVQDRLAREFVVLPHLRMYSDERFPLQISRAAAKSRKTRR